MRPLRSMRLAPEWITDCLWVLREGDVIRENYAPVLLTADYDVPADLVTAIEQWDAEFQATFVPEDPLTSGFPDEPTTLAWRRHGEHLAERLALALGVHVELHVTGHDRTFTP